MRKQAAPQHDHLPAQTKKPDVRLFCEMMDNENWIACRLGSNAQDDYVSGQTQKIDVRLLWEMMDRENLVAGKGECWALLPNLRAAKNAGCYLSLFK